MNTLSFLQRLKAETPAIEKKIQVVSLILSSVVSYLFKLNFLPQNVLLVAAGIFAGTALLAQFAVKDSSYIKDAIADPSSLLTALPDILNQILEIKTVLTSKTPPDIASAIDQIAQLTTGESDVTPHPASKTVSTHLHSADPDREI